MQFYVVLINLVFLKTDQLGSFQVRQLLTERWGLNLSSCPSLTRRFSDINRNAVSDSQMPPPINIVRLSHNGSLPLTFIFPFPSRFLTRLVLTACNILVAATKYPRKTFPLPEGKQRCPIKSGASYGETTGQRAPGSAIKK